MKDNTVQSFSIYKEYYDLITLVSRKERAELLLAISEYMFDGIEPELNDNQMKIFNNLKRPLDKSKNKSKNSAKQNENKTETKQNQNKNEIKSKLKQKENDNNNKTKTHQDVNVVVNNNTLNNKDNSISKEDNTNEDSNRDRVIGKEKEKETSLDSILDFVEKNYGRSLTPYEFEEVNNLVGVHTEPIVLKAYKIAFEQGNNKLSYIKGILKTWKDCGLDSLEKIEEDLKKGKKSVSERKLDAIFTRARKKMEREDNDKTTNWTTLKSD